MIPEREQLWSFVARARAYLQRTDWWTVGFSVAIISAYAWYLNDWRQLVIGAFLLTLGWMATVWFGHLFMPRWLNRAIDTYWRWWDSRSTWRR